MAGSTVRAFLPLQKWRQVCWLCLGSRRTPSVLHSPLQLPVSDQSEPAVVESKANRENSPVNLGSERWIFGMVLEEPENLYPFSISQSPFHRSNRKSKMVKSKKEWKSMGTACSEDILKDVGGCLIWPAKRQKMQSPAPCNSAGTAMTLKPLSTNEKGSCLSDDRPSSSCTTASPATSVKSGENSDKKVLVSELPLVFARQKPRSLESLSLVRYFPNIFKFWNF